LYRATDFSACATLARQFADSARGQPALPVSELDEARTYLAACLIRAGDTSAGDAVFQEGIRSAIAEQRTFPRPNALVFPDEVLARFEAVERALQAEIEAAMRTRLDAARQAEAARRAREAEEYERQWRLYELAAMERSRVRRSRWLASVPFGVGQFQNGDIALGRLLLVTELLAVAGMVGGVAWEFEVDARFRRAVADGREASDAAETATDRRRTARGLWAGSLYALGGLAGIGVLQAHLAFERESVREQPREVPPELRPRVPRPATPSDGSDPRSPAVLRDLPERDLQERDLQERGGTTGSRHGGANGSGGGDGAGRARLTLRPALASVPGGGWLGVAGRF
jgi:hypothetical protein